MENHQLVNQTSGIVEYGSPPEIIEAARQVMGSIDLDPATSRAWNEVVRAKSIYTVEDDGLAQEWRGRIWMNHPFGKSERACRHPCKKSTCGKRGHHLLNDHPGNEEWINKLVSEYEAGRTVEALCITFASTSEQWFKPLLLRPQCFLVPRTNYYVIGGKVMKGITKGSVVTYFGADYKKFAAVFTRFGVVKAAVTQIEMAM
jgi:hypothetical protein